jgi:phospholipid transport system transporter-binding protein
VKQTNMAARSAKTEPFDLTLRSPERGEARGPLVFATARRARSAGLSALRGAGAALVIDCGALGPTDSAGLAVLLDWLAEARGAGRKLRFEHLPEELLRLARISAVDGMLQQGV